MSDIDFSIPIKCEDRSLPLSLKVASLLDSYFYFGGRIAVILPKAVQNREYDVRIEQGKTLWWQTALKVVSYATVVMPLVGYIALCLFKYSILSRYNFTVVEQGLPDGTIETGTFRKYGYSSEIELIKGTQKKGDQLTFIDPPLILKSDVLSNDRWLNFASVQINGRGEIIPVLEKRYKSYIPYPGSPYEALLEMCQRFACETPLMTILKHPQNYLLKTEEFINYLNLDNQQGKCLIQTLSPENLRDILEYVKENHLPINLHAVHPTMHETLFSKWAGKGEVELVRLLVEIDPTVMQPIAGQTESYFAKAVLEGRKEESEFLKQEMERQQMSLSQEDQWLFRAMNNDCSFSNDEFVQLPVELQSKIFRVANTFACRDLVLRLRECRIHPAPSLPEGSSIVSYDMDLIDVEDALKGFLHRLRQDGRLLTKEEFAHQDPSNYVLKENKIKTYSIERIPIRDYMERTARQMNLEYIKFPKKIAVIDPKNQESSSIQISADPHSLSSSDLQIYSEKIEPISRHATRVEIKGLLDLIEATGWWGEYSVNNLMMGRNQAGEEGIYFINTRHLLAISNPFIYSEMMKESSIPSLMKRGDLDWLKQELIQRKERWKASQESNRQAREARSEQIKPIRIEHGFDHRKKPFNFPIIDLL